MKYLLLCLGFLATTATADGFKCRSRAHDLSVQVYNSTDRNTGTRTPATVIISDSSKPYGSRLITKFTPERQNQTFVGYVGDWGFKVASQSILGVDFADLSTVDVYVDFNYYYPKTSGSYLRGRLTLVKTDGEEIDARLFCTRYLKNP